MSVEERVLSFLLDDIALDLCFEVRHDADVHSFGCVMSQRSLSNSLWTPRCRRKIHQQISTVGMSLEELHEVEPIPARRAETPTERPNVPASEHSLSVSCCRCARQVHASRYTAHLEKCMSGSRRKVSGAERHALAVQNERRQLEALGRPPLPSSRLS